MLTDESGSPGVPTVSPRLYVYPWYSMWFLRFELSIFSSEFGGGDMRLPKRWSNVLPDPPRGEMKRSDGG